MNNNDKRLVKRLCGALNDDNRMEIVSMLFLEEMNASQIVEKVAVGQSTVSYDMKILVDSGLVKCRKQEKHKYYSINKEMLKEILRLSEMVKKQLDLEEE
ncbi:MAG: metalloregulator ArsR/SmtB family transcription factor [Lachnospiraceae bacterium]|nr:metalloregulator ArsR/SmtB family transcription factor [Lachnospiraceae bacterium]